MIITAAARYWHDRRMEQNTMSKLYQDFLPWLAWLSGQGDGLRSERSTVRFPTGARTWVLGQAPRWGVQEQPINEALEHKMFLSLFLPLSPLSKIKS